MKNNYGIILCSLVFFFFLVNKKVQAQLTVNTTFTPQQLVQNVLLGPGVIATNITFTGNVLQRGTFDATNAFLGFDSGVILSSGDINVAIGPNNSSGATLPAGGFNGPGDPDLNTIAGVSTYDASVLEFDFVPNGDTVKFNYIFASEEYLEYVNAGFNDAFGFFLSGPGIFGPYTNNAVNIALIPSTVTPVTIDNVNPGSNPAYYVDNGTGSTAPYNTDPQYIQFDGRTVVLEAVYPVQCSQTYHIKLAIADAGDAILESGVFIKAASFRCEALQPLTVTFTGDSTIIEGCTDATFTFTRSDTISDLTVYFDIAGNAVNGIDYDTLVDSIVINQGSFSADLTITPLADTIAEGIDTIILTVYNINACGDTIPNVAILYIIENFNITVSETVCDNDSIFLEGAYQDTSGTYYDTLASVLGCDSVIATTLIVNPTYSTSDPAVAICNGDSTLIYGTYRTAAGTYYASFTTVAGCDSVYSTVLTVNPTYNISDPAIAICTGDSTLIYGTYRTAAGTYYDSLTTVDGCDSIHSTVLSVNPNPAMPIITQNGDTLSSSTANSYQWFFIGDTIPGETSQYYTATQSGFYTVAITDANGCSATSDQLSVTISSIKEYESIYGLKIYPNPNTGKFTLALQLLEQQDIQIKIYNIFGQVIFAKDLKQVSGTYSKQIDFDSYQKGIYNFQIFIQNDIINKKLIIH